MTAAAVVFDWYATLAAPHADDFWERLPELIEQAGGVPDAATLAERHAHPVEHRRYSTGEALYRDWQRRRLDDLFVRCGVHEPARSALLDHIDDVRYTRLFEVFDDVPGAVSRLKQQGVTVGICSNWDWDLDRHLAHNGLDDVFDFVVCSASVGYRKPHPAIFERVLARAGVAASEVTFVGDDWHDDVTGARTAGFTPVHISRSGTCPVADHDGVTCVTDLRDPDALHR